MTSFYALVPPLIMGVVGIWALWRRVDIFDALTHGAAEGLKTVGRIFPALVALITAVNMLRASGALDAFTALSAPLLSWLGIPSETASLLLLRPFSGSGALAAGSEIISRYGADSLIGRTAAVMLGSTETTFYTISVYFGSWGITRTRYAVPAALIADLAGFLAASWTVRLFFP